MKKSDIEGSALLVQNLNNPPRIVLFGFGPPSLPLPFIPRVKTFRFLHPTYTQVW